MSAIADAGSDGIGFGEDQPEHSSAYLSHALLTHAFGSVPCGEVRDLMADDRGKAGIVDGDGHDTSVDANFATRNDEGIGLIVGKEDELPLGSRNIGDGGEALADSANASGKRGVVRPRCLLFVLLEGLQA